MSCHDTCTMQPHRYKRFIWLRLVSTRRGQVSGCSSYKSCGSCPLARLCPWRLVSDPFIQPLTKVTRKIFTWATYCYDFQLRSTTCRSTSCMQSSVPQSWSLSLVWTGLKNLYQPACLLMLFCLFGLVYQVMISPYAMPNSYWVTLVSPSGQQIRQNASPMRPSLSALLSRISNQQSRSPSNQTYGASAVWYLSYLPIALSLMALSPPRTTSLRNKFTCRVFHRLNGGTSGTSARNGLIAKARRSVRSRISGHGTDGSDSGYKSRGNRRVWKPSTQRRRLRYWTYWNECLHGSQRIGLRRSRYWNQDGWKNGLCQPTTKPSELQKSKEHETFLTEDICL